MGLKVWTDALMSGVDIVEDVAVGVTAKMGLNPEANKGLLAAAELLLVEGVAETGLEDNVGVLLWPTNPKGPEFPAARAVLDTTETSLGN